MEQVPISKKRLLEILDMVLDDDDSLLIGVRDNSDVRYVQRSDQAFPNAKCVQSDDEIIITAAWGLKWWQNENKLSILEEVGKVL